MTPEQENLPSEATPATPETGNPPVTEVAFPGPVDDPGGFVDAEDQDPDDGVGVGE